MKVTAEGRWLLAAVFLPWVFIALAGVALHPLFTPNEPRTDRTTAPADAGACLQPQKEAKP